MDRLVSWRGLVVLAVLAAAVLAPVNGDTAAAATRTQYASRATFLGALTGSLTDDYGAASGYPPGFNIYGDAAMSAIFGQTDYNSTGFTNWNFHLSDDRYCAGCNGSFRLIFTSTSFTSGNGVQAVGLDITSNDSGVPYWAYVTYGDGSTENFSLPPGSSFFGLTSPDLIQTIHFGLQNGAPTTSGYFVIDNLTIGSTGGGGGGGLGFYGTTGYGWGSTSTLVKLDPDTGAITDYVGPVGYAVNGLTYDATTGTLYGGTAYFDSWNGLITIDMTTGAGTPVGQPYWGQGSGIAITNITTNSAGDMYGWSEWEDSLVRIDKYTGVATVVNYIYLGTWAYGLSFDPSDRLFLVNGGGDIYEIDTSSGNANYWGYIPYQAHHGDFRPDNGRYYGLDTTGYPRTMLSCDLAGGYCDYLSVVDDLHTMTFVAGGGGAPTPPPEAVADMSIAKSDSPDPVMAGANLTYSITATNNGPDSAGNVSISDVVPTNTRFVSATPSSGGSCTLPPVGGTGTVTCSWSAPTGAGSTRTVSMVVRPCAELSCGTSVSNSATVSSTTTDRNTANNTTPAVGTTVRSQADVAVSKTDSPDPVIAGQNVTYQVRVTNNGPSNALGTVLVDTLPALTKFVSAGVSPAGPTCSVAGQVVTCNLGNMGATGQCSTALPTQYTVTIVAQVSEFAPCSSGACPGSPGQPLANVASVSGSNCEADPNGANNTFTAYTEVLAGADVEIQAPVVLDAGGDVPPELAEPGARCVGPGAFLTVRQTFSNTGPRNYSPQRDNPGPEFQAAHPAGTQGVSGSCVVVEGDGACTVNEAVVEWNGRIDIDAQVVVEYRVRVRGGVELGTELAFTGRVDYDQWNTLQNTASRTSEVTTVVANCPSAVDPNRQLGMQVHLPILTFKGADPCDVWIEVQNIGAEPVKAVLVTWGEMGFCPPQAAGPLKVECTGLLAPGTTWNLLGDQIPDGSKSGMLFKFSTKQLSDFGLDEIFGFDDIFADLMCETLFFGVVGDADDFRRFKKAYNEGGTFAGIPQDIASGADEGGILAVDVLRTCDADTTAGAKVTSKYNGVAGSHLGEYDPVYGGYSYYVPLVYVKRAAGTGEYNTWVYIQNGGLECSSVEIWLKRQEDCLRAQICEVTALAPGETYQFDPSTCVGPNWLGSLWIRTTQPMGVAVDLWGNDVLMTYVGEPAELNYTFDPLQAVASPGNEVAFGPLVYSEYQGWDSAIQVQNLSPVVAAKVKVYFLDRGGDVVTTLVDWICPRGSQSFFLPVVDALPGTWVGSVRVESQEWITPGGPAVRAPNIVAVATLVKYADTQRAATREAIAYNLLPEHKIYDWQLGGPGAGGLEGGVGLIALPSLLSDVDGTGVTSEVAITNVVPKPGFTDFAIYIYDQNGLLDYVCQKLNEKQVEYIDLSTWGFINVGFKGSAVISATFWEHDVFGPDGFFLRNLVGLGAVVIERSKSRLGQDIPGDEAAGDRGIPFKQSDVEDEEFAYAFLGPQTPLCPGLPENRPEPGECPAEISFACENCPLALPDVATATALVNVQVPAGCQVTDVDVSMDMDHTWFSDLRATMTTPVAPNVALWSGVCGPPYFRSLFILDDEAGVPIGSQCPPVSGARYTTSPVGALAQLYGEDLSGQWEFTFTDMFGGDSGTLHELVVTLFTR